MGKAMWVVLAVALVVIFLGGDALAKKGGGGGKPGGGGEDPVLPPDIAYIALVGGKAEPQLHGMQEDGSGKHRLFTGGTAFGRPTWSPDGTQVGFRSTILGDGIYVIKADGTGLRKVTAVNSSPGTWLAWSPVAAPDGEYKLAFVDKAENPDGTLGPSSDIFVVNLDGTGLLNLTDTPANSWDNWPSWSPDATQIAYKGDGGLSVLDLGTDQGELVVTLRTLWIDWEFDVIEPGVAVWSHAGQMIAFDNGVDGDVWILDLSETVGTQNPWNATDTSAVWEGVSDWSPDDGSLLCVADNGIVSVDLATGLSADLAAASRKVRYGASSWKPTVD